VKALVLGGTGFVGMNVSRALVRAGHDVVMTRRIHDNTLFARKLGGRLEVAELDDLDSLVRVMRGRDVVFMCAAHYPRYSIDHDAEVAIARQGIRSAIDACLLAGVQRFVLTSSVATVGPPRDGRELSNESDPMSTDAAQSVYHAVKMVAEHEVLAARSRGLDCIVVCPTGIIGELDVKAGTGFIIVALSHGMLPFYIDGRQNIIDADEMAAAHIAAAERGRSGERYIAAGHNVTIREFMERIADELAVPLHCWRIPLWLAGPVASLAEMRCATLRNGTRPFLAREFVDMVCHGQWVDRSKSVTELGLSDPAPLTKIIRKACLWYERHGYLKRRKSADARA
jgi:dihydroflavonol-4-reductase